MQNFQYFIRKIAKRSPAALLVIGWLNVLIKPAKATEVCERVYSNGRYFVECYDDALGLKFLAFLFILAAIAIVLCIALAAGSTENLPDELKEKQPPEYYLERAAALRAHRVALDEEAEYARARVENERAKAELKELQTILKDDAETRRPISRGR